MKKLRTSDGWMKTKNAVANVLSAPSRAINWYKGASADTARGNLLRKRGLAKPGETNIQLANRKKK